MEKVFYNYAQTEQENLNNLLKAAGYPEEHFGDITVSEYTPDDEVTGRGSFKVTIPNAESPLYPLMGNVTELVHTFKRANVVEKATAAAGMEVETNMDNYQPEEAIKAKFISVLAPMLEIEMNAPYDPDVYSYEATLTKPVDSNLFKGLEKVAVKTMLPINRVTEAFNPEKSYGVFVPYANRTVSTNGSEDLTIFPRSTEKLVRFYLTGEVEGDAALKTPLEALQYTPFSATPEIQAGIRKRLKDIVDADPTRFTTEGTTSSKNWSSITSLNLNTIADPVLKDFITKIKASSSTVMALTMSNAMSANYPGAVAFSGTGKFIGFAVNAYSGVKEFLFKDKPVTLNIRSENYPARVKPASIASLPPEWFSTVGVFDDVAKKLTFDMSAINLFQDKTEFETACLASIMEALSVGNYAPTITLKASEELNGAFATSYTVDAQQSSPGVKTYKHFFTESFVVEFLGKKFVEPVETVTIDMNGFDEV